MRREEAERLVEDGQAIWIEPDAIQIRATGLIVRLLDGPHLPVKKSEQEGDEPAR